MKPHFNKLTHNLIHILKYIWQIFMTLLFSITSSQRILSKLEHFSSNSSDLKPSQNNQTKSNKNNIMNTVYFYNNSIKQSTAAIFSWNRIKPFFSSGFFLPTSCFTYSINLLFQMSECKRNKKTYLRHCG